MEDAGTLPPLPGECIGLFTRTLVGKVAQVIAVEPDARMRKGLTAGADTIDIPMRAWCWRVDRLARMIVMA